MPNNNAFTFPVGTLTPLSDDGPPTFASLQVLQTELNSNAMSVPSTTSTGYGHLVLTVPPEEYAVVDPTDFPPPANPGLVPTYARNASAEAIAETNSQHKLEREDFSLYWQVERELRASLVIALPHLFIEALYDETLGWGNTTTLQLLTHLHSTYGGIDEDMLADNLERIKSPWSPPTPIDVLFAQIKSCRRFAQKGGDPISEASAQRTGLQILEATGLFQLPCREWRSKPINAKNLAIFFTHFREADKENRRETTSFGGGYQQSAHHLSHVNLPGGSGEETILTTPSAFASAVAEAANYASPPALLAPPPVIDYTALAAALSATNITTTRGGHTSSGAATTNNDTDLSGHGYCWSHGFMKNPEHTSATCNFKKPGHKEAATALNTMGGKTHVWKPKRNERR